MNNDWLDIGILEDYLDGKLDAKTMNRVELEALEDPFVAEALAGLSESPKRSLQSLSLLQKQLQERIATEQVEKKTRVISWQRLSIAATAAVLFISVSIIFWMKENVRQQQLANRPKKVEVNLAAGGADKAVAPPGSADAVSAEVDRAVRTAKTNAYAANKIKKQVAIPAAVESIPQQQDEIVATGYAAAPKQHTEVMRSMARIVAPAAVWAGKVADEKGVPLPGTVVRIEGTNLAVTTDRNGEFSIPVDSTVKTDKIQLTALGFESKEFIAKADVSMDIRLKTTQTELSEMVVVSSSRQKKAFRNAEKRAESMDSVLTGKVSGIVLRGMPSSTEPVSKPVNGWDKLLKYLDKENKFRKEPNLGRAVELTFLIGKDGRPVEIKVSKSIETKYDEEAIRLIQQGPKWEQTKTATDRMIFSITF